MHAKYKKRGPETPGLTAVQEWASSKRVAMDFEIEPNGTKSIFDQIVCAEQTLAVRRRVRRCIDELEEPYLQIIHRRYFKDPPDLQRVIARDLKLSRARIAQLQEEALEKLCNRLQELGIGTQID